MPCRVLTRLLGDCKFTHDGNSVQTKGSGDCVGLGVSDTVMKPGDVSTIKITTKVPSNPMGHDAPYRILVGLSRPLNRFKKYQVVDMIQELEAFLPIDEQAPCYGAVSYLRMVHRGRRIQLSPGSASLDDIYRQTTPSLQYTKNNLIWVNKDATYICDNPESTGTWRSFHPPLIVMGNWRGDVYISYRVSEEGCVISSESEERCQSEEGEPEEGDEAEEGSEESWEYKPSYDIEVTYLKVTLQQDGNGTLCNLKKDGEISKVLIDDLEGEYVWVGLIENNGLEDVHGIGGDVQVQVEYL